MTTTATATAPSRREAVEHGTARLDGVASGTARQAAFRSQIRATRSIEDGKEFVTLDGYASVTDINYKMWDWYGEYDERIAAGAFDKTLAADPDVAYLLNHTGMTMARTVTGTLQLSADEKGLRTIAKLNAKRVDVSDLIIAVEDENVTEMSFAFRIVAGQWSPDYMEYTITEVDLDRGDVSAVNYGANPYTSISARAQQALEAIDHLDGAPLRAARDRAAARLEHAEQSAPAAPAEERKAGRDKATELALLSLDD
ncbi:HK97 family phage prohead protease [Herbiconiux sp. VKM Ac-2851]|uniref:HK97 family phage prohead protease n=1 Tax=Herbiconiux sp. VKM Ac-2851 TaxID=2739025 RepID=UPI001566807A|nr:HK97 family phage prohead protease [Herbiconiux sp. VKM Ac-2851]NQX36257.1 HK97 family phage prohead protease [Herbiconiux sp. VKM Ac-2851]